MKTEILKDSLTARLIIQCLLHVSQAAADGGRCTMADRGAPERPRRCRWRLFSGDDKNELGAKGLNIISVYDPVEMT